MKNILIEYIIEIFKNKMIIQEDRIKWFGIETVSMKDIRTHKKNLLILFDDEFYTDLQLSHDSSLNEQEIENKLKKEGIFLRNRFAKECNYYKNNSTELIETMEKCLKTIDKKRLRVSYYLFSAKKKFQLSYLLQLPTVEKLEKEQFIKKNIMMSHLIECIHNSEDINIGTIN